MILLIIRLFLLELIRLWSLTFANILIPISLLLMNHSIFTSFSLITALLVTLPSITFKHAFNWAKERIMHMPCLELVPADQAQCVHGLVPWSDSVKFRNVNNVALVAHHILDPANVDWILNVGDLDHCHPWGSPELKNFVSTVCAVLILATPRAKCFIAQTCDAKELACRVGACVDVALLVVIVDSNHARHPRGGVVHLLSYLKERNVCKSVCRGFCESEQNVDSLNVATKVNQ